MSILRPIWLLRFLVGYSLFYLPARFLMPLAQRMHGYKRSVFGTCTILAPPKQMQIILQAITYLQKLDPEIFLCLTAKHRYIFWYHPGKYIQCRRVFSISDNFLFWGNEGVTTCFVQSILHFTLWTLPSERGLITNREAAAIHQEIQRQVFEWVKKHSFQPELVKQYEQFAENG
jgi:hypothetical protein